MVTPPLDICSLRGDTSPLPALKRGLPVFLKISYSLGISLMRQLENLGEERDVYFVSVQKYPQRVLRLYCWPGNKVVNASTPFSTPTPDSTIVPDVCRVFKQIYGSNAFRQPDQTIASDNRISDYFEFESLPMPLFLTFCPQQGLTNRFIEVGKTQERTSAPAPAVGSRWRSNGVIYQRLRIYGNKHAFALKHPASRRRPGSGWNFHTRTVNF
ncbi:hypothetical protein EVAR_69790_1 [Eumeta japonica]|uniref:Uncharacterized protein n=1 Tax=Eumeta variegata TaxID=151549 RepID=A0A4C2A1U6_EUMVA|nr:hypothetical protein EVAR_69790_1 [Eumeta japonica]